MTWFPMIRFIPNIKVIRRVWKEEGILRIELGKYWEIRFTRDFINDYLDKAIPKPNPTKLDGALVSNKRIIFTKQIKAGNVIPKWYGFAYHNLDTASYSYMPIPLNLLFALSRWIKWNILRKIKFEWPERLMLWEKRIYRLGQLDGYNAGRFVSGMSDGDATKYLVEVLDGQGLWEENDTYTFKDGRIWKRVSNESDTHKMLEGVDPHTNPGWNKLYRAGE